MTYRISEDVALIREFFQMTQEEFAEILGVDRITLVRQESNLTQPRIELVDNIYNYCFNKDLRLNIQKEMLYKDDLTKNQILLMHASVLMVIFQLIREG